MNKLIEHLKKNQQQTAIVVGYILVFLLAFGLGKLTTSRPSPPEIRVEEPTGSSQSNDSAEVKGTQTEVGTKAVSGQCPGKIKGNIGSSGKIYHLPGGSFYNRTNAEVCFATETQAQAAGFRRSQR